MSLDVYKLIIFVVYTSGMDVTVTDLRAHLSSWLERARNGDDVVITDRGVPVARLTGLASTATLERLAADGVIGRPATAQSRRPLADIVSDQRR
jgi:prevent-host-death family protein